MSTRRMKSRFQAPTNDRKDRLDVMMASIDSYQELLTTVGDALEECSIKGCVHEGTQESSVQVMADDRTSVLIILRKEHVLFAHGDRLAAQLQEWLHVGWYGINPADTDEYLILITL